MGRLLYVGCLQSSIGSIDPQSRFWLFNRIMTALGYFHEVLVSDIFCCLLSIQILCRVQDDPSGHPYEERISADLLTRCLTLISQLVAVRRGTLGGCLRWCSGEGRFDALL
jgi:hypothetical protein